MCVRGGLQSKLYTSQQWRRKGGRQGERSSQTWKICKGCKTFRASASSEPREQGKIKIFVNFLNNFIKNFSKTFKIFNIIVKISSNF